MRPTQRNAWGFILAGWAVGSAFGLGFSDQAWVAVLSAYGGIAGGFISWLMVTR